MESYYPYIYIKPINRCYTSNTDIEKKINRLVWKIIYYNNKIYVLTRDDIEYCETSDFNKETYPIEQIDIVTGIYYNETLNKKFIIRHPICNNQENYNTHDLYYKYNNTIYENKNSFMPTTVEEDETVYKMCDIKFFGKYDIYDFEPETYIYKKDLLENYLFVSEFHIEGEDLYIYSHKTKQNIVITNWVTFLDKTTKQLMCLYDFNQEYQKDTWTNPLLA